MTKQSKFEWEQPKLVIASPIHIYRTPQKKKLNCDRENLLVMYY